jgi:hypothetical protein
MKAASALLYFAARAWRKGIATAARNDNHNRDLATTLQARYCGY